MVKATTFRIQHSKFIILCIVYSSLFIVGNAQNKVIDSLKKVLATARDDSNKVILLDHLCGAYDYRGNYSAADSLARKALQLAEKLGYKNGMGSAYRQLGNVCYDKGNYAEALENQMQSLKIFQEINNLQGVAYAYGNIGNNYYLEGNYPEALKNQFKSLEIDEKIGNKADMGTTYIDIGIIYGVQKNYTDALNNLLLGVKYAQQVGDSNSIANAYDNIGSLYENQNKYKEAIKYLIQSLGIAKSRGLREVEGNCYENIGCVYADEKHYDEAMDAFQQCLTIDSIIGDKEGMGQAYHYMGSILTHMKKYGEAKQYLDKALKLGLEIHEKENIMNAYNSIAEYDSATGNYSKAFADYKQFIVFRDSLQNDENIKKIVSEQMQYEFDKKQAEEKAEQDKRDAIAVSDKRKQLIITASIGAGLLLVLIFSSILFSRFRITQRQKNIIERQKSLVEEKNKEILDSITYAKRLQDAILPPMSIVEKYLPESFVLYKPKDIVAGDFYWLEKTGAVILIAAADCTGHGVPGAMVSVVCSNALNRTVKEFKITEPGKILDKVRELVLETFEKSEGDIKDGMDISLASLSPCEGGMLLKWAGAYNSLWYMQHGEMKELPADKQPIGKMDNPKPFTTHTIKLSPPSEGGEAGMLYLFTDGYADQFGGPKGKKFKYKQLQERLLAISHQPMAEQKMALERTLEEWKGDLEQVDDVLVIGIKV